MNWDRIPVWAKTFLAGLCGAVGGAIVDIAPTLIKGNIVDWNATMNAAIVGAFLFIAGYFKNLPSQMRSSDGNADKLKGP